MTIHLAAWTIPLFITVAAIMIAALNVPPQKQWGHFPDYACIIIFAGNLIVALIVSLVSWIVYAFLG